MAQTGRTKKMETRQGGAAGQARNWRVFRRVVRTSSLPTTAHHQRQGLSRHAFGYPAVPMFSFRFSPRPWEPTAIHPQLKAHALNSYYEGYGWYAHSLYNFQIKTFQYATIQHSTNVAYVAVVLLISSYLPTSSRLLVVNSEFGS